MLIAPIYLVIALIGLRCAFKRRSSFPKAFVFAFAGFLTLAVYNFVGAGIVLWWLYSAPLQLPELTLATVADRFIVLAATTALALAVFADRDGRDVRDGPR